MKGTENIRTWMIVLTFIVGFAIVVCAAWVEHSYLQSVLLVLGSAIGLVGVLFLVEQTFLRAVKTDNEATLEKTSDIVDSATPPLSSELKIDVEPTLTKDGKEPMILVRITDPEGDYTTKWSVQLIYPTGEKQVKTASWPGSGRKFRARFPCPESRSGTWKGVAVRNEEKEVSFSHELDA